MKSASPLFRAQPTHLQLPRGDEEPICPIQPVLAYDLIGSLMPTIYTVDKAFEHSTAAYFGLWGARDDIYGRTSTKP
ncbi:hypothetical protein E4U42_000989, partial [Claviceps africana]